MIEHLSRSARYARKMRARGICPQCCRENPGSKYACDACRSRNADCLTKRRRTDMAYLERVRRENRERMAARRHERKVAGLCVICGKELLDRHNVACQACRQRRREYRAGKPEEKRRQEIERKVQYEHDRRLRLYAAGLCIRCGGARDAKHRMCLTCRIVQNKKKALRRQRAA